MESKYYWPLKFFGYKFLVNQEKTTNPGLQEIIISVSNLDINQNIIRKQAPFYKNKKFTDIINIFYIFIILVIIGWPYIYIILESIIQADFTYITSQFFTLLFLVQFICGIKFFNSDFFVIIPGIFDKYKYKNKIQIGYIIGTIISTCLGITYIIILFYLVNQDIFYQFYISTNNLAIKIIILIGILSNKIFQYNTFFINLITISCILKIHHNRIKNYKTKMENIISDDIKKIKIDILIKDYSDMKSFHSDTISALNSIFSSITMLGILGCLFTTLNYGTNFVTWLTAFDISCFVIVEIIFIYIIGKLKDSISYIKYLIDSPKFTDIFLNRNNNLNPELKLNKKSSMEQNIIFIKEKSILTVIKSLENSDSLDWIILNDKLSEEWDNFYIFGFEFDDLTIIQKLFSIIIGFILMTKIGEQLNI